jgi:hypothetical protein
MRAYSMTREEAYHQLPLVELFALHAAAVEGNPMIAVERDCPGYVQQHWRATMASGIRHPASGI